ncbi:hypothetical protein EV426DRAFT_613367 [Tirmania nivea]|nr:hypothetical protein EV426DRAFT_613367 [Tirmania nivea]
MRLTVLLVYQLTGLNSRTHISLLNKRIQNPMIIPQAMWDIASRLSVGVLLIAPYWQLIGEKAYIKRHSNLVGV